VDERPSEAAQLLPKVDASFAGREHPVVAVAPAVALPALSPAETLREKASALVADARGEFESGNVDRAKHILKRAANLDTANIFAHINLGVILGLQNDFAGDAEQQEAALLLDPSCSVARLNLAWARCQQEQWHEAIEQYDAVLKSGKLVADAYYGKAMVLAKAGRTQPAIDLLLRAKQQCKDAWPLVGLSKIYMEADLNDQSMAEVKQALTREPSDLDARKQLAQLYAKLGSWKDAAQEYVETNRVAPYDLDAYLELATVQKRLQDKQGAVRTLRTATELAPANASAHANLSLALEQVGDKRQAATEARLALKLNPKQQIAQSVLSRVVR
jgi:tetratricopeptide (TPR) repeat protein